VVLRRCATAENPQNPYALYQRPGSAKWWVRFSIPGEGQIRKPLGTAHRSEAERLALEAWAEAKHRKKIGLRSQPKTFRAVAAELIAHLQTEADSGQRRQFQVDQYRRKIERYLIGFFGDRLVDNIRDRDISEFQSWRLTYWTTGPGKDVPWITYMRSGRQIRKPVASMRKAPSLGTQREEAVIVRMLLRQAGKWGYIPLGAIPTVEMRAVPANGRPSFTPNEFARLDKLALERLEDLKINNHLRRDRAILYSYIRIAASTGLRPTELKNLNWGDILGLRECRSTERVNDFETFGV
jgi:integrase